MSSQGLNFRVDDVTKVMEEIDDISEKIGLSVEEKLFFVEVLAAFCGAKDPDWSEVSILLPHEPRVKEACRKFFEKHKLSMADIETH